MAAEIDRQIIFMENSVLENWSVKQYYLTRTLICFDGLHFKAFFLNIKPGPSENESCRRRAVGGFNCTRVLFNSQWLSSARHGEKTPLNNFQEKLSELKFDERNDHKIAVTHKGTGV